MSWQIDSTDLLELSRLPMSLNGISDDDGNDDSDCLQTIESSSKIFHCLIMGQSDHLRVLKDYHLIH